MHKLVKQSIAWRIQKYESILKMGLAERAIKQLIDVKNKIDNDDQYKFIQFVSKRIKSSITQLIEKALSLCQKINEYDTEIYTAAISSKKLLNKIVEHEKLLVEKSSRHEAAEYINIFMTNLTSLLSVVDEQVTRSVHYAREIDFIISVITEIVRDF